MRIRRMRVKVCVVGERGVGKTSLVLRYLKGQLVQQAEGSSGAQMHSIEVEVSRSEREIVRAKVALFDLAGDPLMREAFRDAAFYGTHGVLAVSDITRPPTLYAIADWVRAVSIVTGGVPFSIALNKGDCLAEAPLSASETKWLGEQFPVVPAFLTSAITGEGVAQAFDKVVSQAIDGILAFAEEERSMDHLRQRILAAVARKESTGMSKRELLEAFKDAEAQVLMDELDTLVRLELLTQLDSGPKTFVPASSAPVVSRFRITPAGRTLASGPTAADFVVSGPS